MGWPQWVFVALVALEMGYVLAKDGQPKAENYSFVRSLVSLSIIVWLLCAGGFFG